MAESTSFTIKRDPYQSFTERHGGWILSICAHIILFTILFMVELSPPVGHSPSDRRIRVVLHRMQPAEAGSATELAPVQATRASEPLAETAPTGELPSRIHPNPRPERMTETRSVAAAAARASKTLDPELQRRMEANIRQVRQWNQKVANQGSHEVAHRIQLAKADLTARETLYTSRGFESGAVREIDMSDVPPQQAKRILEIYRFKYIISHQRMPSTGIPFLNSVQTRDQQFVSSVGRASFAHIFYGNVAKARMAQLEEAALRRLGHDPAHTRVTYVVFGAVNTTDGYDLGVKRIEVEPVPE